MSLRPLRAAVEAWRPTRFSPRDPLQAIVAAWPAIVGEQVAAQTAPRALSGDALVVATRSSAWSQQLQFLAEEIVRALRALPEGCSIARLVFRSGALRHAPRRARAADGTLAAPHPRADGAPPEAAANQWEALARVRRRVADLRKRAPAACGCCGAPLDEARAAATCAPCGGDAESTRLLEAERVLFMVPWLGFDALSEHVVGLRRAEYERARRQLLQRWWSLLQRTRSTGRLCASGIERKIASSYVLLQSRVPPGRITAAVVRNLLGEDLEELVSGTPWGSTASSPNKIDR